MSTVIHRNPSRSFACLGTVALIWHWNSSRGRAPQEGGVRLLIVFPVGSRLEHATSSKVAPGPRVAFASTCDISNFLTAVRWNCRATPRSDPVRAAAGRAAAPRRENNRVARNLARACCVECLTPGGVPPAPNPSPIRRKTLALRAPGSSFIVSVANPHWLNGTPSLARRVGSARK